MKSEVESYQLLDEDKLTDRSRFTRFSACFFPKRTSSYTVSLLFGISVLANALLGFWYLSHRDYPKDLRTSFAGLVYDTPAIFERANAWVDDDDLWHEIQFHTGNIALDHEYAASMGLPVAQDFPWDNSKGLYFTNGHYALHCIKALRMSFLEAARGKPITYPMEHILHCFEALREDIICAADDTPLASTYDHPGSVGWNQNRVCRSWDALEKWAQEHWSCFRDISATDDIDTLLRYRYCPPESPYYDRIHAIFGDFEMGDNASAWN